MLSAKNRKAFFDYLASPPHKAFAVDARGSYGWRSGRDSVADAKKFAIAYCEKQTRTPCRIYARE